MSSKKSGKNNQDPVGEFSIGEEVANPLNDKVDELEKDLAKAKDKLREWMYWSGVVITLLLNIIFIIAIYSAVDGVPFSVLLFLGLIESVAFICLAETFGVEAVGYWVKEIQGTFQLHLKTKQKEYEALIAKYNNKK